MFCLVGAVSSALSKCIVCVVGCGWVSGGLKQLYWSTTVRAEPSRTIDSIQSYFAELRRLNDHLRWLLSRIELNTQYIIFCYKWKRLLMFLVSPFNQPIGSYKRAINWTEWNFAEYSGSYIFSLRDWGILYFARLRDFTRVEWPGGTLKQLL